MLTAPANAQKLESETRFRHESVSDARYDDTAQALTWRLHLGAQSESWQNAYLAGSAELVGHIGSERFNDGVHSRATYPDVADPDAEELDELYVGHATEAAAGRFDSWVGRRAWFQDRQRFLGGGTAWRQNAQSWEGAGVTWSHDGWAAEAVALGKVRRPAGNHSPRGRQKLDGRVLQLSGPLSDNLNGILFAHWLDYAPGPAIPDSASNRTLGATLAWAGAWQKANLSVRADAARQREWHASTPTSGGNYYSIELGLSTGPWRITALREILGSDGQIAVQTPLAGLHAFNGHADRFLRTPIDGLDDRALGLAWKHGRWQIQAIHHWYSASKGSLEYGTETDSSIGYTLPMGHRVMAKWARYSGNSDDELIQRAPLQSADVEKFWMLWEWKWAG